MMLAFALPPAWAGEKTIVINRNEGIYEDGTGVYYCSKGGITMTFSSGLNNVNYLVEHQQVVFDIFSNNYVIKKIKFNCLDNTTDDNLDCFYWGPSTISEFTGAPYTPTGTYTYSGYIGTWVGGSTPSKYVKFETEGKPVRFGSVEITIDKEFGDIYEKVTENSEIQNGQTYVLVSQYASKALGKEDYYGNDNLTTFTSTPVTLLDNNNKVRVTDEVQLMKLQSSGNSSRPWYIKVGDNYMRRRSGNVSGSSAGPGSGQGYNLYSVSSVTNYEQYFRVSISVSGNTNNNALIKYEHNSTETAAPSGGVTRTFAIRHYNGGSLFRDIDYSSNNQYSSNQRVYLYKPAQTYYVTTTCLPNNNSGYITLGEGVLNDGNGNYTSQHYDNVSFFVGPTDGWGVGTVTVTNLSTNEVTTLTPTAANDFGNDYQFPMPAANVNVTANFLSPLEIDTVCNPANGGQFNFINGYTNFSGQYYSNEGKTVTFKPTAADGYIFQSVTMTDNGVTTTMTPDANGVYSFVMPDHAVTLTANFEEAHDLYLLGTANGQTAWHPYGPKFTFDGENQVYYIDVYFKGDSLYNNGAGDPYGHFSLSRMISTNPDENTGWGEISGSRIYATSLDYWVEDGNTYNNCFQTGNDMAFKIPAGVYRITVSKDLDYMSIDKYEPTLVFTPAGGDSNNPTVVDINTVVTVTSNLEQLVHDINPNEPSHMTFYYTTDNWATPDHQANSSTCEISEYGVTTIIANVNLGYIKKEDNASYEVISDLYLLGTANGLNSWQPYGPKFTYDANTQTYSLDVYFTGLNVTAADEGFGYFSLSKVISDPNDPKWSDIPSSARYNAQYNDVPITGLAYNQSATENLYQTDPNYCFKIDPGVYTITVNKNKTEMTVTKHELTLTFDPVSGTTVAAGDQVNISSNLELLVHTINPDEPLHTTIEYATSLDGTLPTPNTVGSTVTITEVDATTTVNAQAALGYITVTGNANYIVPAATIYNITTQVNPEGSNAGVINAPTNAAEGETVNFTVTDTDASVYTLTGIDVVDSNNGIVQNFNPNGTGSYSFTMPDDDVTIHADYERTRYDVTTSWSPSAGGAIWLNGVNTPQTVSVANGNQVVFGVSPAGGYNLVSVTVTNTTTEQEITPTPSGSNEYTFVMPTGNVTVMATFESPLSEIERTGVEGETYTIADQLVGVFAFENSLWCKDQGNRSIAKTSMNAELEQIDYMLTVQQVVNFYNNPENDVEWTGWDQSNWIELILDNNSDAADGVGKFIDAKSVTGKLTDVLNYKMEVQGSLSLGGAAPYLPNIYCCGNFNEDYLMLTPESQGAISKTNGKHYFFLNPKVQEYALVTFAMWDSENKMFVAPERDGVAINGHDFDGAFRLDPVSVEDGGSMLPWHYNMYGNVRTALDDPQNANNMYQFHIIVQRNTDEYGGPIVFNGPNRVNIKPDQAKYLSPDIKVYPLDLNVDANHVVTAVNEVNVARTVKSVEYVNAAGQISNRPFNGFNIVVTRYSDGSCTTVKMIK